MSNDIINEINSQTDRIKSEMKDIYMSGIIDGFNEALSAIENCREFDDVSIDKIIEEVKISMSQSMIDAEFKNNISNSGISPTALKSLATVMALEPTTDDSNN